MIEEALNKWENVDSFSHFDSSQLDLNEIVPIVENILYSRFGSSKKSDIKQTQNRLNFSCPYCGDSEKKSTKTRGNLYLDTMQYHCYNCSKHTSFFNFVKKFTNITGSQLNEIKLRTNNPTKQQHTHIQGFDSKFIDKYSIPKKLVLKTMGWQEISHQKIKNYLNFRLVDDLSAFAYDPKYDSLIILNSDFKDDVIGLQIRPMSTKKTAPRFYTYNISKLYQIIFGKTKYKITNDEELAILQNIDNFSTVFNILKTNFNKPITVFEGPFDSLMYYNSIATSGATKNLPFASENVRYWYDNDETGRQKTLSHLEKKDFVFLWTKYWQDLGEELRVKDLNELLIYSHKHNIPVLNFDEYFSNDEIDAIFI